MYVQSRLVSLCRRVVIGILVIFKDNLRHCDIVPTLFVSIRKISRQSSFVAIVGRHNYPLPSSVVVQVRLDQYKVFTFRLQYTLHGCTQK